MIHSANEFVKLRTSPSQEDQYRATHESALEEVWFEILADYPDMAEWVIHNKTVPLSILYYLAEHSDPHIRWCVASKRKLDNRLFQMLSNDGDESVRRQIAYNKKTPRSILEELANDPSPYVSEIACRRLETT